MTDIRKEMSWQQIKKEEDEELDLESVTKGKETYYIEHIEDKYVTLISDNIPQRILRFKLLKTAIVVTDLLTQKYQHK